MFNRFVCGSLAIIAFTSAEQALTVENDGVYAYGYWKGVYFPGSVTYNINVGFYTVTGGDVATEQAKLTGLMDQGIKFGPSVDVTDAVRQTLEKDAEQDYGNKYQVSVYC